MYVAIHLRLGNAQKQNTSAIKPDIYLPVLPYSPGLPKITERPHIRQNRPYLSNPFGPIFEIGTRRSVPSTDRLAH